jgi:inhibitor of KinA sporulation pathway (predicted exonuclease)
LFPRATAVASVPTQRNTPNPVERRQPPPPFAIKPVQDTSSINWENVLYVVFDLETTGTSRQRSEIIELAAVILDKNGIQADDGTFSSYIRPTNPIPTFITNLTGITDYMVCDAETFPTVADSFLRFIQQHASDEQNDDPISHILLVGHNARVFDVPFFLHQLHNNNMAQLVFSESRFRFGLDTMRIAKKAVADGGEASTPPRTTSNSCTGSSRAEPWITLVELMMMSKQQSKFYGMSHSGRLGSWMCTSL